LPTMQNKIEASIACIVFMNISNGQCA
jgi:hypothetical protein